MDNQLYPPMSATALVAMLIVILVSFALPIGLGILIWMRASGGMSRRTRETVDGQAARIGYSQGVKDAEARLTQRQALSDTPLRLDQILEAMTQVGQKLEDVLRCFHRPQAPVGANHRGTSRHPVSGSPAPVITGRPLPGTAAPASRSWPARRSSRSLGLRLPTRPVPTPKSTTRSLPPAPQAVSSADS